MRYLFPLWDGASLEGFVAVTDDNINDNRFAALRILSQFIANGLGKFLTQNTGGLNVNADDSSARYSAGESTTSFSSEVRREKLRAIVAV